jgi:hypothetical protein
MVMNPMNQEEHDPFDYFRDEKPPQEPEQSSSDDIVNNLRSDLLSASEVEPTKKSFFQQVDIKLIVGIIIGVVIIGLILFLLVGAGRSFLERRLTSLKQMEATSTQQNTLTPIPVTNTPMKPSNTPTIISTVRPTNTVVSEIVASPTQIPATTAPTPMSVSDCRDALTITLADVGKTLCIRGIVIETIANPSNFMVIFSTESGSFYWVSYDVVWSDAELDTCYQTVGTISQIASSPILIFGYGNIPEPCP